MDAEMATDAKKIDFCMQSSNAGDSVADTVPIKMGHKKGISLTSFPKC